MNPSEATHRALAGGHRKPLANRIGVSEKTVDAHCTGALTTPAERVIQTYLELMQGGAADQAREFLAYINRECGQIAIPVGTTADPASLDCVGDFLKESSDIVARFSDAHRDGRFDASDAEKMLPEIEDHLRVLIPLRCACQQIVVQADLAREMGRRGPQRATPRFHQLRRAVSA